MGQLRVEKVQEFIKQEISKIILTEIIPEVLNHPLIIYTSGKKALNEINPSGFGLNLKWNDKLEELEIELGKILII